MKIGNMRRLFCIALLALLTVSLSVPRTSVAAGDKDKPATTAIRLTPSAPVFDDTARVAELTQRRARVEERIGPQSVLVMFSGEPRVYTNDVDYVFRQENNFYYLTNLKQAGSKLVLMPGNKQTPEILFLPRRDPSRETWTGHMYSAEEARKLSGIGEIWEASEFEPFMRALRSRQAYRPKAESLFLSAVSQGSQQPVTPPVPMSGQPVAAANAATPARPVTGNSQPNLTTTNQPTTNQNPAATAAQSSQSTVSNPLFAAMGRSEGNLYLLLPRQEDNPEFRQEQTYAAQWAKIGTGLNVRTALPIFTEMRQRKSASELQLMQHAIDITTEAIERAMALAGNLKWEYEVAAEVEYTFKRRNADYWGYPSIVGCGPNATTLHYEENSGPIRPNSLLLMDVGAEYDHYTADVTRTFPINGKFTKEQAEVYQIVYDAQEAAARVTKPGATIGDVHNAALEVVKDGLLRLGLITDKNSNQYRIWFMHGTSHWLGMNVHDVGIREAKFEPGMTFTNEPGIYVREDALDYLPKTPENEKFIAAVRPAFEKYKNIGVRIEDDMLVTEDSARWMTQALPRSIADIEAFIARASKEMRVSQLERNIFRDEMLLPKPLGLLAREKF